MKVILAEKLSVAREIASIVEAREKNKMDICKATIMLLLGHWGIWYN